MSNNVTAKNTRKPVAMRCWRCGRIIYEDIRNGHTGCRNTKCRGYLLGSKNLSDDLLRQVRR